MQASKFIYNFQGFSMKPNFVLIILSGMVIAIIALLLKHYPHALADDRNKIGFFVSSVLLSSFIYRISQSQMKLATIIKQIIGWLTICLIILTGYSYQHEIKQVGNRLTANLIPGYGQGNGDGSVTFYAGENGHFEVTALINDEQRIKFLFDTGASLISLTAEDARDLGIDTETLNYNYPLSTANGTSFGSRINIAKVQVGPITIFNVDAVVNKPGASDISLLGMSFLSRIKQFIFKGNSLTLIN